MSGQRTIVGHDMCRLSGIPAGTLRAWIAAGRIKPLQQAETAERSVFAVVPDALALATVSCMRGRGLPREVAGKALDVLLGLDEMDIDLAFASRRRYLLISGHVVSDGLVDEAEVQRIYATDGESMRQLGLFLLAIDVKQLYGNLMAALGREDEERGKGADKPTPA